MCGVSFLFPFSGPFAFWFSIVFGGRGVAFLSVKLLSLPFFWSVRGVEMWVGGPGKAFHPG